MQSLDRTRMEPGRTGESNKRGRKPSKLHVAASVEVDVQTLNRADPPVQGREHSEAPERRTHDIFIRSYKADFQWLALCLKAIAKYCTGFRDVIVVVPEQDKPEIDGWNLTREKVFGEVEEGRGYLWQQYCKMSADRFTDAEVVVFMDSDCIVPRPLTPDMLYSKGKLNMVVTPYERMPERFPWKPATEKALGFECPMETMRRHPFAYPMELIVRCREHLEALHGQPLKDYIMGQETFSEFNALGAWCLSRHRDRFHVINTDLVELPPPLMDQYWSRDQNKAVLLERIKRQLDEPVFWNDEPEALCHLMDETLLSNCPFCGGKARILKADMGSRHYVGCEQPECHGFPDLAEYETQETAAKRWNARAIP